MTIPVFWWEGIAGLYRNEGIHGRSRYACCGILNEALDQYDCEHISGYEDLPKFNFAVVVIHGGHLRHQAEEINVSIAHLHAVICIIIGDEEADFNESWLRHPNMKVWRQSPIPGKSNSARYPVVGYPCDCKELLVHGQERKLDWFFAGQVTNKIREQCVASLRGLGGGKLLETQQFYSGMPHDEYYRLLGQAKIVPCASGPCCSDTFRLAEALEAGCVPVIDSWPGWLDAPRKGFWEMLFPQGYPWPCVEHWSQFPRVLADILNDYDNMAAKCAAFWKNYKQEYYSWLGTDLRALGASV